MQTQGDRRDLTGKESLLLVIYGVVTVWLSFPRMDLWGSGHDRLHSDLYFLGCLLGLVAFLAGILSFLWIGGKALFSGQSSSPKVAVGASTRESTLKARVVISGRERALLWCLRVVLIGAIVLAYAGVLRDSDDYALKVFGYGKPYALSAVVVVVMSQLPYGVALVRTRAGPDGFGIAIAITAGLLEAMFHWPFSKSPPDFYVPKHEPSPLAFLMGIAIAALGYAILRNAGAREGRLGYLFSVFLGILGYTVLWRVAHASTFVL